MKDKMPLYIKAKYLLTNLNNNTKAHFKVRQIAETTSIVSLKIFAKCQKAFVLKRQKNVLQLH
jgi:hypothetical protein